MRRQIRIVLGSAGQPVGTLHFGAEGGREGVAFTYGPEWLARPDRFAIDPALPLVAGPQFHRKGNHGHASTFFGCFADSEPDGWGKRVIARDYAKHRREAEARGEPIERRPLTSLDYLLMVDDFSRVGALRMVDEEGRFLRAPPPGTRAAPPLIELRHLVDASHALEAHRETAADLRYLRGKGTSLGGMRPKCSVVDEDGSLLIGKFPSIGDDREVTRGEVLALRLAKQAGINAADARVVESEGAPVALIRRFDRVGEGRIMYASARTLLGDGDDHAYTEIVDAIRSSGSQVRQDLEELWRRVAFSVLITNVDDHLNNHGFLHDGHGTWRLAPAFDVNPFPDKERALKTWISEDSGPEAAIEPLMKAAGYFGLTQPRAKEILAEVEGAVSMWRDVALSPGVGMTKRNLDSFADAFEHDERQVARRESKTVMPVGPRLQASVPAPARLQPYAVTDAPSAIAAARREVGAMAPEERRVRALITKALLEKEPNRQDAASLRRGLGILTEPPQKTKAKDKGLER
jgi:serine/threonine-protein kinase HipA